MAASGAAITAIEMSRAPAGCEFATERYGMSGIRFWNHSGLMPANLITFPHFSVSSAISLPNSAGEPGSTVAPKSAKRALIIGSARPAFTSLLSISMIAAGVSFGTPKPSHALAS